jgi:hypothetical protein
MDRRKMTIAQLEDLLRRVKDGHDHNGEKDYVIVRICTDLDGSKFVQFEQPSNWSPNSICYSYNQRSR